ncbi:MAG: hypothetical protein ACRDL6_02555 [Solirubrobacterales bacterium]
MTKVKKALGRARSAVLNVIKAPARGVRRAGSVFAGPRARTAGVVQSARERPRYAIAIAAAILLGIAWIAWAIYVTANNGAAAGLGVLLSWPVLLGALALIAAPFVLTAMLVQRHRDSTPAIAGAPDLSEPREPKTEEKPKADADSGEAAASGPKAKTETEADADSGEPHEDSEPEEQPAAGSA